MDLSDGYDWSGFSVELQSFLGVPEFRPDFKKVPVPVPAGIIIGPGRNKILLKTALFPNCFKLFHELIQLTKTISDYGEEMKVFRQFLEEVCFFFLHICFRIRRTAFLNKQMTEVVSEISSQLFSENVNVG